MDQPNKPLVVLRKRVDELRFDPKNSRRHGEANLRAIRDSLARFGQATPIVIRPDGTVLAGNATFSQAVALGWTELDVVVFDGTDQEAIALALALNRTASLAEWDEAVLQESLAGLDEELRRAAGFASDLRLELELGVDDDDVISEGESSSRSKKRFLFTAEEVLVVEQAIQLTEKRRRGAAIAEVCREYLAARGAASAPSPAAASPTAAPE